jgi:hypothetical protein
MRDTSVESKANREEVELLAQVQSQCWTTRPAFGLLDLARPAAHIIGTTVLSAHTFPFMLQ